MIDQDLSPLIDVLRRRCPEVIECCSEEHDPDTLLRPALARLIIAAIELECADEAANSGGAASFDRLERATSAFKGAA